MTKIFYLISQNKHRDSEGNNLLNIIFRDFLKGNSLNIQDDELTYISTSSKASSTWLGRKTSLKFTMKGVSGGGGGGVGGAGVVVGVGPTAAAASVTRKISRVCSLRVRNVATAVASPAGMALGLSHQPFKGLSIRAAQIFLGLIPQT